MTGGAQFTVDTAADEGFYVFVSEEITVYDQYDDAVAEVQQKLSGNSESFLAAVDIENTNSEDVAVTLEQVGWQQIIQDMADLDGGLASR